MGGINLCTISKASLYRPTATHVIEIDTEKCIKKGIFFFGNLFTDVVYCTGAWENGDWNGKVPLECLRISCREQYGFLGLDDRILCGLVMFVKGLD